MKWLGVAGVLALFTVTFQFWFITNHYGRHYITEEQLARSQAITNHTARAPYRYRLLSDTVFYNLSTHFKAPEAVAYLFRLSQNLTIFLLAGFFLKTLHFTKRGIYIGWLLITYAMCFALHQSDLGFSSYSEIIFALAAAIAAFHKQAIPFVAIVTLSAINRESSLLLSSLWLIHVIRWQERKIIWHELPPIIVASLFFLLLYASIYMALGPAEYSGSRYGRVHPGLELLWLNLTNPRTWLGLISMYFPMLMLWWRFRGQKMADWVRIWGAALVLPWYSAMLLFGSADETRLFLLPAILWAIPASLSQLRTS